MTDCFATNDEYIAEICRIYVFRAEKMQLYFTAHQHLRFADFPEEIAKNKVALDEIFEKFAHACWYAAQKKVSIPLYALIQRRHISKYAVHLIMATLAWEFSPDFCRTVKSIPYFKSIKSINTELAAALYDVCDAAQAQPFLYHLPQIEALMQMLFTCENNSLYTGIKLQPYCRAFLLQTAFDLPYYCSSFFCTDSHSDSFSPEIIAIKGEAGAGRKTFLQQQHKNTLFCSTLAITNMKPDRFQKAKSFLLLYAYLNSLRVCLLHLNDAYGKEMQILHLIETLQQAQINICITFEKYLPETITNKYLCRTVAIPEMTCADKQLLLRTQTTLADSTVADIVSAFSFTPKQLQAAAKEIAFRGATSKKECYTCCMNQMGMNLTNLAEKITAGFVWDDLVLTPTLKQEIRSACAYVKYRHKVYQQWDFAQRISYGKGLNILFTGPPGTGKTMLSQVIANELHMELYRIDLSSVVSKYIGETEENIGKIFDEAQNGSCILFFDEMDSLFGKRSETQDARDKYANMETAYILQRIEAYDGVVLMATNYLSNIDEAFMRRIHFIFHIPLPDEALRLSLWQKVFPPEAPLDEAIDFQFLSSRFTLSGAAIKNIAVSAAVFASAAGTKIMMQHILQALVLEMKKQGNTLLKSNFGAYYYILED